MLNDAEIQAIRECFQKYAGAVAFKELTEPTPIDPLAVLLMKKAAATDQQLFRVAMDLSPGDPFAAYELLGGQYRTEE